MKKITSALLALAFGISGTWAGTPGKLPGRSIDRKHVPDTIPRFLAAEFANRSFTYRQDKETYYACQNGDQYILFSRQGAVLGFRFHFMQPSREVAACVPEGIAAYIREHYPGNHTDTFLPEGEGFRAELFGKGDKILHFDRSGTLLREETPGVADGPAKEGTR